MKEPHTGERVLAAGRRLGEATAGVLLVHGRGGSAEDMLALARELGRPDLAYLAPQAAGRSWYPYSFLAPLEQNEPGLSSGLELLGHLVGRLEGEGIPPERLVLLGFSQGACLMLEYAARHARRFGGLAALSGGLIGPPGTPREYASGSASFAGTPAFLGCSDRDPHIPLERVKETTGVLEKMGARVTERIYPALGHTVNEDELEQVRGLLALD